MFVFLLFGIIIGIYIKETYNLPPMKPYLDRAFGSENQREKETEIEETEKKLEKEKKNSD